MCDASRRRDEYATREQMAEKKNKQLNQNWKNKKKKLKNEIKDALLYTWRNHFSELYFLKKNKTNKHIIFPSSVCLETKDDTSRWESLVNSKCVYIEYLVWLFLAAHCDIVRCGHCVATGWWYQPRLESFDTVDYNLPVL